MAAADAGFKIAARFSGRQLAAMAGVRSIQLANRRRSRARDHHRLAGFDHLGGLAVVNVGACGDAEARHRDAGHQRHHHDLEVGRTVGGVN